MALVATAPIPLYKQVVDAAIAWDATRILVVAVIAFEASAGVLMLWRGRPARVALLAAGMWGLAMLPVIPPHQRAKEGRAYDRWLYRERHLVECFINKLKHFRRIFSRFEKLASRYLGFLHFVSALIWLR